MNDMAVQLLAAVLLARRCGGLFALWCEVEKNVT